MLDTWKMALESLVYGQPSPHRVGDAHYVMAFARKLSTIRSVGELRHKYARLLGLLPLSSLRDADRSQAALSPGQIRDAAFGLRYLELVNGRHIDVRSGSLLPWLLAVTA